MGSVERPGVASTPPGPWRAAAWAVTGTMLVAGLGGLATDLGPWYQGLRQPEWKPPDAWFGPAWTVIYTLTAIAVVRAWRRGPTPGARHVVLAAAAVNGALNVAWSVLFFRLRRPDLAQFECIALWASIAVLAVLAQRHDRWAVLLLLPYLAWVAFAGVLNHAVVRLNGPFT